MSGPEGVFCASRPSPSASTRIDMRGTGTGPGSTARDRLDDERPRPLPSPQDDPAAVGAATGPLSERECSPFIAGFVFARRPGARSSGFAERSYAATRVEIAEIFADDPKAASSCRAGRGDGLAGVAALRVDEGRFRRCADRATAKAAGCERVVTFDKHARKAGWCCSGSTPSAPAERAAGGYASQGLEVTSCCVGSGPADGTATWLRDPRGYCMATAGVKAPGRNVPHKAATRWDQVIAADSS